QPHQAIRFNLTPGEHNDTTSWTCFWWVYPNSHKNIENAPLAPTLDERGDDITLPIYRVSNTQTAGFGASSWPAASSNWQELLIPNDGPCNIQLMQSASVDRGTIGDEVSA